MANTVIRIKRSTNTASFANIVYGEPAFTANGDVLYIGGFTNGTSVAVAGARFPGTLTANQAIVVDTNSHIDSVQTGSLTLSDTGVVNVAYVGVVSTNTLSGANSTTLVSAEAIKAYVDAGGSANTSTSNATFAFANQTITFTRDDSTTYDVQVAASITNTSTTTAVFTSSNNTLLFTRDDGSTYSATIATDNLDNLTVSANASIDVLTIGTSANVPTIYANNIEVSNTLTVNGDLVLRGSSINLGDGGDVISLGASVNTSIIPTDNVSYDLGSSAKQYRQVYANQMTVSTDPTTDYQVANKGYVDTQIAAVSTTGNTTNIGYPTDGAYANGSGAGNLEGAVTSISNTTSVADAFDKLNEAVLNVYNNTFVRDVTFTVSSGALGGAPLNTTLSITPVGNADRYDINWGDGSYTNNTTDSTPSHSYTDNSNSPFDVVVTARNTGALGEGNTASFTSTDLVTLYTGDPSARLLLKSAVSGGSTITEANTGQEIFLDNDTTNANNIVGTFFVNWGDSSTDSIANTSVAGGTQGARIGHTYSSGTGSGTHTVTLSINTHSTANPASLPSSNTKTIKIFDTSIAAPEGLSSKSLAFTSSSTGTAPRLAQGFIDNSVSGSFVVDSAYTRFTTSGIIATSGEANSQVTYDAANGILTSVVDNIAENTITFTAGDDTGSNGSLVVVDELDFYNYNNSGSYVSASNRIHAPGLYSGFRARISKSGHSTGTHSYKLNHSVTGDTNTINFVKDNLTSKPTIKFNAASVTQNTAGTLAYVSGIPYYTNDAVLNVIDSRVTNVAGQFYRNMTSPFNIYSDSTSEGDSGSVLNSQTKGYTILPSSTLNSGYPIANTGMSANVNIDTFQISINGGGRRVGNFKMRMSNVNGTGSNVSFSNVSIQTYNGTSTGVNENAISVADSLGAGFDTDGVRLSNFSSTNATPTFNSSTDYYASNAWTGAVTIAGTDEAVVRYGNLSHYTTDLSSGYLPAGPDLATGRTGTQYFRFAFKRTTMANMTIRLTGKVSSLHIAAPGTNIDSTSDSNGWLSASDTYAGSGTPGANTAAGGNGSDGCAFTSGDRIIDGTTYNNSTFSLTLGDQNATDAFNNQILVSVGLESGDYVSTIGIE